jgi:hypothetical protein
VRPSRQTANLRSEYELNVSLNNGVEMRRGPLDEVGPLATPALDTSGWQHSADAKPCHVAPRDRARRQLGRHAASCRRSC